MLSYGFMLSLVYRVKLNIVSLWDNLANVDGDSIYWSMQEVNNFTYDNWGGGVERVNLIILLHALLNGTISCNGLNFLCSLSWSCKAFLNSI